MVRGCAVVAAVVAGCGFTGASSAIDAPPEGTDAPAISDAPTTIADAPDDDATPGADARTTFLIEAEDHDSVSMSAAGHAWMVLADEPGYSGVGFVRLMPANGGACADSTQLATCAAALTYDVTIVVGATYFIHVRTFATRNDEDSLWVGVDGVVEPTPLELDEDSTWHWDTGTSLALSPGPHVIDVWQREAGIRVDLLAVSTGSSPPP